MRRREFVAAGLAGFGVAALGSERSAKAEATPTATARGTSSSSTSGLQSSATSTVESPDVRAVAAAQLAALLAPVAVGSQVDDSTVLEIGVDEAGAGVVRLAGPGGRQFRVDICGRDERITLGSVAQTSHYQLFLRNGGQGSTPTVESQGLALYGIADALRANEGSVAAVSLVSKHDFWQNA